MLRWSWLAAALLAAGPAGAAERAPAAPAGLWWAEGGAAQVEISECGDALCGRVVWLRAPFDPNGCAVRDDQNPDPALRIRPLVGLSILRGLRPSPSEPRVWSGGEIYDPTLGRTFRARLELLDGGRLALRGYVGFELLGRTTTWIRVGARPACASADAGAGADPDSGAIIGGACRHPES
jgi:uncharacterized protein (DUF2147 family)